MYTNTVLLGLCLFIISSSQISEGQTGSSVTLPVESAVDVQSISPSLANDAGDGTKTINNDIPSSTEEAESPNTEEAGTNLIQGIPKCDPFNDLGIDCGPYTLKFDQCNTPAVVKRDDPTTELETLDLHSTDTEEPTYNAFELYRFRELELEYAVKFLTSPTNGQQRINLPYCGLPSQNTGRESHLPPSQSLQLRDPLLKRGGLSWPKVPPINEWHWPKLDRPPEPPDLKPKPPKCLPDRITIPIQFIIVTTNETTRNVVTQTAIGEQVAILRDAFKSVNIDFKVLGTTSYFGNEYRQFTAQRINEDSDAKYQAMSDQIKRDTRVGGIETLNIWIVESINYKCPMSNFLVNGYCKFPRHGVDEADGCVVVIDSLPGIGWRGPHKASRTTTLAHEVGHWLDLNHIFPDPPDEDDPNGCRPDADGISDTYQYPKKGGIHFDAYQPRCCFVVFKPRSSRFFKFGSYQPCSEPKSDHVTNYMSYSVDKGKLDPSPSDKNVGLPWSTMQQAKIFASYFTFRKRQPYDRSNPPPPCTETVQYVSEQSVDNFPLLQSTFTGKKFLYQPPGLVESLQQACSVPYDPNNELTIDVETGDKISGPRCNDLPDGIPCIFPSDSECEDGTPRPCPGEGKEEPPADGTDEPSDGDSGVPPTSDPDDPSTGNPQDPQIGSSNEPPTGNPFIDAPSDASNDPSTGNPSAGIPPTGNTENSPNENSGSPSTENSGGGNAQNNNPGIGPQTGASGDNPGVNNQGSKTTIGAGIGGGGNSASKSTTTNKPSSTVISSSDARLSVRLNIILAFVFFVLGAFVFVVGD